MHPSKHLAAVAVLAAGLISTQGASAAVFPTMVTDQEAGIRLPVGFKATIFADDLGIARHIAVRENGDVYVALAQQVDGTGVVALRDTDSDGIADVTERFGDVEGTGIAIHDDLLYFGTDVEVVRFELPEDGMVPEAGAELVVGDFPAQRGHAAKTLAFDGDGNIYVNAGAPSNACQQPQRTPGAPGRMPCDELERTGTIWKFDLAAIPHVQRDGERYATGLRHGMAIDWHPGADALFMTMHGRDQLDTLWPDFYDADDNAELPAEEFHKLEAGSNMGWPYTYWNGVIGKRMVGPEYGGDGETVSDNPDYQDPLIAFPGHWAPNDMVFYTGEAFPEMFRGGAFIAFHGSWNRAPRPQGGYQVAFVPFEDGEAATDWFTFADGFAGADPLASPTDAVHRPTGVGVGPDGALYISDSVNGRIWRVTYEGE